MIKQFTAAAALSVAAVALSACGGSSSKAAPTTTTSSTTSTTISAAATTTSAASTTAATLDVSKNAFGYSTCAEAAAKGQFVLINTASISGSTVTVDATTEKLICGGADDSHFSSAGGATQKVTLPASAKVQVLVNEDSPGSMKTVSAKDFVPLMAHTAQPHFEVFGTLAAPSSIAQLWHP